MSLCWRVKPKEKVVIAPLMTSAFRNKILLLCPIKTIFTQKIIVLKVIVYVPQDVQHHCMDLYSEVSSHVQNDVCLFHVLLNLTSNNFQIF